jgi:hypothetical protein
MDDEKELEVQMLPGPRRAATRPLSNKQTADLQSPFLRSHRPSPLDSFSVTGGHSVVPRLCAGVAIDPPADMKLVKWKDLQVEAYGSRIHMQRDASRGRDGLCLAFG